MPAPALAYELVTEEVLPEPLHLAHLIPENELVRRRTEQFIRGIGATAIEQVIDYEPERHTPEQGSYANLLEMLRAADGDQQAQTAARINVRTHVWECLTKAGLVAEVPLAVDVRGRIMQHGQLLERVYENSWRWAASGPEMRERTGKEIYNGFLAETWLRLGLLEGQRIVVFSPYPTDPAMDDERARRIGFFPETKTLFIQSIGLENGKLVQKVASVAGVKQPGGERHDIAAIQALTAELGAPITADTSAGILGTPLVMPSDVTLLDIVKLYDQHAGTFFGQDIEPQDYEAYRTVCRERLARLEPIVQDTMDELVAAARNMHHPTDATRGLHDIAQRHMVAAAAEDHSIDERVFGPEAVQHIQAARQALEADDWVAYNRALGQAQRTAVTGSCPIEEQARTSSDSQSLAGDSDQGGERAGDGIPSTIRCTKCHKFSSKSEVVRKDSWRCPKCTYQIDVCTGKVLHESVVRPAEPLQPPQPVKLLPFMRSLLAAA